MVAAQLTHKHSSADSLQILEREGCLTKFVTYFRVDPSMCSDFTEILNWGMGVYMCMCVCVTLGVYMCMCVCDVATFHILISELEIKLHLLISTMKIIPLQLGKNMYSNTVTTEPSLIHIVVKYYHIFMNYLLLYVCM